MIRLYHQVYLTIIASLLLVVIVAGALWRFAPSEPPADTMFDMAGEVATALLPPASASVAAQRDGIERLHARFGIDLALFDAERRPIAAAGRPLQEPRGERLSYGAGGPAWTLHLPDGRWLVARARGRRGRPFLGLFAFLGSIALVVALCAYPLVRRLTRRLERLQAGVESLGAGDLTARVEVRGKDEVARLAHSFNRAAARIEELVGAHKLLLANTSHELRTPLARIRLGLEFLARDADPARRRELEKDIGELDALLDEILLSSRLDVVSGLDRKEEVDLLALAAEEGARFEECLVSGVPVVISGDPALLRRMMRNLIDNARRHGVPPVEVDVRHEDGRAVVMVSDRGAGVLATERERVFSPFYRLPGSRAAYGTGLGLTLVRQIARRHGGEALWAGTAERPSTLRVILPLRPPAGA